MSITRDRAPTWAVTFDIPGRPCLNNRVYRHVGGRAIKSAEARAYQARVRSLATEAALEVGWTQPTRAAVEIEVFNSRGDVDSFAKCILDGCIGSLYDDDRCVVRLTTTKQRDKLGERLRVTVVGSDANITTERNERQ